MFANVQRFVQLGQHVKWINISDIFIVSFQLIKFCGIKECAVTAEQKMNLLSGGAEKKKENSKQKDTHKFPSSTFLSLSPKRLNVPVQ